MSHRLSRVAVLLALAAAPALADANATLTALAQGFDYAAGELKAAAAEEKGAPQSASQKYLGAAQYADGLLASIAPLEKAGQLAKDGTVATQSAGTLSAKDFLQRLQALSKAAHAGVDRLAGKVKALDQKDAAAQAKAAADAKAKRDREAAELQAHPPAEYARLVVTNAAGEPLCEVNTISTRRDHKRIQYLEGKPPVPASKALVFSIAPGPHNLFIAGCGKSGKRRTGAIALRIDPRDVVGVDTTARQKSGFDWKVWRIPYRPPRAAAPARPASPGARPSAAEVESPVAAEEPGRVYEEPEEVSAPAVERSQAQARASEAPPTVVEEPPPEVAPPPAPECKPDGSLVESGSECCHTWKMEEVQDESSGAWRSTGRIFCVYM